MLPLTGTPLGECRFSAEVVAAARMRLRVKGTGALITSSDVRLIAASRSKKRYAELSAEEHEAYAKVSSSLEALGNRLKSHLTQPERFEVRTTSGFNVNSGVRSYIPKDLWFSVSPKANAKDLAGMPQLFMIVSERGVEYGYGASVSPSDFSQQTVKDIVRRAAPIVFEQLPSPDSPEATGIQDDIESSGTWYFRRKHRLPPNQHDFNSFKDWLRHLKAPQGKSNAAGTISRYLLPDEVDAAQLDHEVEEMARLFETLVDRDWHPHLSRDESIHGIELDLTPQEELDLAESKEFASLLSEFLRCYGEKRSGAFSIDEQLAAAMHDVESWLEKVPAVSGRPTIKVKISVGQGGWTKTPWIALLDNRETTTTQSRGIAFEGAALNGMACG